MSNSLDDLKCAIVSGDRELPQSQLLENAARAAAGLSALGVGPGDSVAIMLRNDFPFFEASMAANAVGAHAVPINWHFQAEEAAYILRDCKAKVLVVHADLLPHVIAGTPSGVETLVVSTPPEIRTSYGLSKQQCRVPE